MNNMLEKEDDGLPRRGQQITNAFVGSMNAQEIIEQAPPEHARILKAHFEEEDNILANKIGDSSHIQSHPKYLYISGQTIEVEKQSIILQSFQILETLYICEQCVCYFEDLDTLTRHYQRCIPDPLPGKEIYRDDEKKFVIREADGFYDSSFVIRLCQIGRCFIGHKQLQYDVEPFSFYSLFEIVDGEKYRFVGYFSKQKYQHSACNLCCLLVLPCHQGKGYGRLLIDFSFLLSKTEDVPGGPEFPLSDTADVVYYKYILESVYEALFKHCIESIDDGLAIEDINITIPLLEHLTGIGAKFLVKVLLAEKILKVKSRRKRFELRVDSEVIKEHMINQKKHPTRIFLHPEYLDWDPPSDEYDYEELLHFPEIEEEKIEKEKFGTYTRIPHPKEKLIIGTHLFYFHDSDKKFDERNEKLCMSRSRIFISKPEEDDKKKRGVKRSHPSSSSSIPPPAVPSSSSSMSSSRRR